jgi:uncharacterized repeat protein (TIGR04138 family)
MLDPSHPFAVLLREDRRYAPAAYEFVFLALRYAQEVLGMGREAPSEPAGEPAPEEEAETGPRGPERHVSGQDLCEAARQLALEQFGYMAKTVLNSWGIRSTADIGEIVYNLIRIGQMRKTPDDRIEDFHDVYDFDAALRQEFRIRPPD